jgi:hypothetical protein
MAGGQHRDENQNLGAIFQTCVSKIQHSDAPDSVDHIAAEKRDEFPPPHGFAHAEDYIGYAKNSTCAVSYAPKGAAPMSAFCHEQTHALQQTACLLMEWSGRAAAPPAIKAGQGRRREGACHGRRADDGTPIAQAQSLVMARDHQFIISCSQFGRDSKF